jgi:hypothetical protein
MREEEDEGQKKGICRQGRPNFEPVIFEPVIVIICTQNRRARGVSGGDIVRVDFVSADPEGGGGIIRAQRKTTGGKEIREHERSGMCYNERKETRQSVIEYHTEEMSFVHHISTEITAIKEQSDPRHIITTHKAYSKSSETSLPPSLTYWCQNFAANGVRCCHEGRAVVVVVVPGQWLVLVERPVRTVLRPAHVLFCPRHLVEARSVSISTVGKERQRRDDEHSKQLTLL